MKKKSTARDWLRMTALSAALACGSAAHAQIPVTDVLSVTNAVLDQVETLAQWDLQINQMINQFNQMKSQLAAITGPRGMANLLNSMGVNVTSFLPPDFASVLANVKATAAFATERAKYPDDPTKPKANNLYDTIAAQRTTMAQFFKMSNDRLAQVQSLMGQIDSAGDPAAKQDLTNRLVSEQNALQANSQVLMSLQANQKQELDAAGAAAAAEWQCSEFKSSGC